jgi:hypothetical protein
MQIGMQEIGKVKDLSAPIRIIVTITIIIIIIIIILLQMGFSPVAVVQQVHNRQVNTHYTK